MGLFVRLAPQASSGAASPASRLFAVFTLVRYRFFLFAGLLPYLLGAVWAQTQVGHFDLAHFFAGLAGVALAVVGVEAFNEYFDSRLGTDRIFNPADVAPVSAAVFWLGVAAFAGALAIGIYLTWQLGWAILGFAVFGGLAAVFYEAPPVRWSFRGLGEMMIGLAYGPAMVLGSLSLHTPKLSWAALLASFVPGFAIMALAVVNAIPDFQQDRLIGKRNLVVRLGRRRAVWLYLGLVVASLASVILGVVIGAFPLWCLTALLALPLLALSARHALKAYERPRAFSPAIRAMIICYLVLVTLFGLGFFADARAHGAPSIGFAMREQSRSPTVKITAPA